MKLALLTGASYAEAGTLARVSERTVRRWMADPAFRGEYEAERRVIVDRARSRIAGYLETAVSRLGELIGDESSTVAFRASSRVIELSVADDIEQRLAALEARLPPED